VPKQNRQAVVIGVNDYKDSKIPKLFGAVNDATEMRKKLSDFGGFEIAEEHFLINRNATGESIRKAMSDLLWKTDACDLALFYFSGHGIKDGYENGYIAPYDMVSSEPFVCGINMEELKKLVLNSKKECVLVILDCCFSGISTKGERDASTDYAVSFNRYFSDLKSGGKGKIILASSGEDQKSREIELMAENGKDMLTYGYFTHYLIEGLDGKAANENGVITVERLYKYAEKRLLDNGQQPQFYISGGSQLDNIQIAVSSEQLNSYLRKKLDLVKKYISDNNAYSLFTAIEEMQNVLENSKDNDSAKKFNDEVLKLKEEIQRPLSDYHIQVGLWFEKNDEKLHNEASFAHSQLEKLPPYLDNFETIFELNQRAKNQLKQLCRISIGEIDDLTFFDKCKSWNSNYGSV
jgi:hypothetical protein